mgnify:CR=1 FL=1
MDNRRSEAPSAAIYPWQNGAMRERRLRVNLTTLLVTLVVVAGCGGGAATASLTPTPSRTPLVTGSLTWNPCPADDRTVGGNAELLCTTLAVPRDYADATAGTIDLALALEPCNEPRLEFQLLFTDELVFLVGASHPWAKAGAVVRDEIPAQNYILYNKGSYTFRLVQDYFRREGVALGD